ncbi:exodeoxyribonuclease V subunit gamma [Eikenella sp. S3360]|uniref:RecBCD enzyme subunit RecC n=1 Tax=Eikenella glucosivorans TaxID=2766967 RepID=A0ABS0N7E2_9NEIS|nr:exodeoxyribonuclease V subunit gamma [Eikenella glucosivorans]MBH5328195.1 exodeoxyribonuclease V subunit gamma [Eikenella glucosivorans]
MLHLYQSNRLEFLAETAVALMQASPPASAFAPEEIIVQSQGMRRYLNHYLAERSGIAANLNFSLPAALSWQLTRRFLPAAPRLNPFAPEVLRWRLLPLLDPAGGHAATLPPVLQGYLSSSPTAAYHLAGRLADVFDQYLVYRPQWLAQWERGRLNDLGSDEDWQAELWRILAAQSPAAHRATQHRQLLAALRRDGLPQRYLVFGISTLAPLYLELLEALAEHTEVHLFAVNPSQQYWGDLPSPKHLAKRPHPDAAEAGHPLLASLGKQGRDFFDHLAASSRPIEPIELYPAPPESPSLLQRLQTDIQLLRLPEKNPAAGSAQMDGSIVIQAAHSPLRELQILKDHLLRRLAEQPDLQPHHIAVLTPAIEDYLPFIHAVFGEAAPGSRALPYNIADVRLSRSQPLMLLAEQLIALMQSRFETERLLPLLDHEAVRRQWQISADEADFLRHSAAELNIRWGADAAMRAQYGGSGQAFTWRQGEERSVLGWLLPADRNELWQGIHPWSADLAYQPAQAAWFRLLGKLRAHQRLWQSPADIPGWAERFRALLDDTAGDSPAEADQAARQQIMQALAGWQDEAALAGYRAELPPDTACEHLRRFLAQSSEAGFLRGGITFCSMVPMRSLPFPTLCLLGLNDGKFPRQTKAPAFDLIARHPQPGDRSRRDDDRYLFLESLISARRELYLSYIGRDHLKDEAQAPSPLLSELVDTLAQMLGQSSADFAAAHIRQHPLQAFSARYFSGSPHSEHSDFSGSLSSTRQDYAQALNHPPADPQPFIGNTPPAAEAGAIIPLGSFLNFWKNPVRYWLHHALQWQRPYAEAPADSAEPYAIADTEAVKQRYLDARRHNEDFAHTEALMQADSLLPAGRLGQLLQAPERSAAKQLDSALLSSPRLLDFPFQFAHRGMVLAGSLNHLYQHGQIFYRAKALNAPDTIELWLQHLVYCAVAPQPQSTHLLLPGSPNTLPPLPAAEAAELLGRWLDYHTLGQQQPLPFFPRTSLAAAEACTAADLAAGRLPEKALDAARGKYRDNRDHPGQNQDSEVAQVFGRNDDEPIHSPLFANIVLELLAPLSLHLNPKTGKGKKAT